MFFCVLRVCVFVWRVFCMCVGFVHELTNNHYGVCVLLRFHGVALMSGRQKNESNGVPFHLSRRAITQMLIGLLNDR